MKREIHLTEMFVFVNCYHNWKTEGSSSRMYDVCISLVCM